MSLIGRTAASVATRTSPRNSEMDRPHLEASPHGPTRLARLFTTFGQPARKPFAHQERIDASQGRCVIPSRRPCVAFRHRDVLTLWIEPSGSHRSVRPKGTFVGRPNVRAYDGFMAGHWFVPLPAPSVPDHENPTTSAQDAESSHAIPRSLDERNCCARPGQAVGPTAYRFVTVTLSCGSPDRGCYEAE